MIHMQAQAMWDARRLVRWIQGRSEHGVGVMGVSLGGYSSALLSSLEDGLSCVIAGIPATCFVGLARMHMPDRDGRLTEMMGLEWERLEQIMRVVSPLAIDCRVDPARRYMFAGTGDRLVPPEQVHTCGSTGATPRSPGTKVVTSPTSGSETSRRCCAVLFAKAGWRTFGMPARNCPSN